MTVIAAPVQETVTIRPYHWTRTEFDNMVLAGIFDPEARIELIEGEILDMGRQGSWHATALQLAHDTLRDIYGKGFVVRNQLPIAISEDSEPVPDIAVVRGSTRDYSETHPTTALLVVEISYSTLSFDRNRKLHLYARSGVPEYWILNVVDMQLEVYRDPQGDSYNIEQTFYATDVIAPLSLPAATISVADLLP